MGNGEKRNPTIVQLGSSSHRTYWKGCLCGHIECSIFLFPCAGQCVGVELIGWRSPSFQLSASIVFAKISCCGNALTIKFFFFMRIVMLRVRLGGVRL